MLLCGFRRGIMLCKNTTTLLYAIGKDIHNASVHSFTHCAKRINKHCVKWVISWKIRGREILEIRNLTCQEMRRVGECHVPNTFTDCGVSGKVMVSVRRRVAYQGKSGLWYLTARAGFCLNGQINTRSSFLLTPKLKMFKSTMREDLFWAYIILLMQS